jgi:DNA polymerase-3 subunit beta
MPLPILETVLVSAKDQITLTANNLETSIAITIQGEVVEKGEVTIHKDNFKLIKKISGDIEITDEKIRIDDENYQYNVNVKGNRKIKFTSYNPNNFAPTQEREMVTAFNMIENEFKSVLKLKPLMGHIEGRITLASICINKDRFIACDGFRLARINKTINNQCDYNILIPVKAVLELDKILDKKSNDNLRFDYWTHDKVYAEMLTITGNDFVYTTRLIGGDYLKVDDIIPKNFETYFELENKKDMLTALDFIQDFSSSKNKSKTQYPTVLVLQDDTLTLKCMTDEHSSVEEVEGNLSGNDLAIGFNGRYLIESLKIIDSDNIKMSFAGSGTLPMIISDINNDDELHMVLPVRLKEEQIEEYKKSA